MLASPAVADTIWDISVTDIDGRDLLLDRYRGRVRLVAMTVIDLAIALLFVVLLWGGVQLMELTAGQTTSGLNLPKGAVYAALPFGAVLMLVEIALRFHRRFSGREASA